MEAVSTVKTEDGKLSCEFSEGTVINININQWSYMDSLLGAIMNVRMVKKDGQYNQPARESASGVHLGVGVSFMSLGFISVMLAIIFAVVQPSLLISYVGTHFWVGFPFLAAGALNVLAYIYPNALWMLISFISLLCCLALSIAGIAFVADDISNFYWTHHYRDYNSAQDQENLLFGLVIMSLLMMIWGICVSVITLIYRLKVSFSTCKCEKVEEENDDPLLSANPTQDMIIA